MGHDIPSVCVSNELAPDDLVLPRRGDQSKIATFDWGTAHGGAAKPSQAALTLVGERTAILYSKPVSSTAV